MVNMRIQTDTIHGGPCPGSGQPVQGGSRCRTCETSFGFPHPANLVVGMPAPEHNEPYSRFSDEERTLNDHGMAVLVARVKAEILADMGIARSHDGRVMPSTVGQPSEAREQEFWGYSELHDYTDANTYGGACDDGTMLTLGDLRVMQDIVHEWLISGQAAAEKGGIYQGK